MATPKSLALRVLPHRVTGRLSWLRRHGWSAMPAYVSREIPGFMHDEEVIALYELARSLPAGAQVVELGAWLGRSSVVLAKGLRGNTGARVHAVDPFSGEGDERSERRYRDLASRLGNSLEDEFRENVRRHGVERLVTPIRGLSHDVARTWATPLDLLFIDANHSYEAVLRDFDDWSPFVKPGGWVAFHDAWLTPPRETDVYHRGPAQVIRERVLDIPEWTSSESVVALFRARRSEAEGRSPRSMS